MSLNRTREDKRYVIGNESACAFEGDLVPTYKITDESCATLHIVDLW